jgi:hypothetical protein
METFIVKTGVDPQFLENVITRDISTQASIFDLVDNSIDAAKEYLSIDQKNSFDEYGLPKDYSGFKIFIRLDKNSFKIIDNCFGIPEETLSEDTLVVGKQSNHDYGLGKYGIGLKRALLKFGNNYSLLTDTSEIAFKMQFSNSDFGQTKDLIGTKLPTRYRRRTLFVVSDLKPLVNKEFSSKPWLDKLKIELTDRYGIFIKKGLKIILKPLGSKPIIIEQRFPEIIDHFNIPSVSHKMEIAEVNVSIEYGLHKHYKVDGGYGVNDLTDLAAFGWYVICNDRVIEIAIRDGKDYGWSRNWHNEYNGFIGLIRFNSPNPSYLPWDTTKTRITTDSLVFLGIKELLSEYALDFRKSKKNHIKNLKKENKKPNIISNAEIKTNNTHEQKTTTTISNKKPNNIARDINLKGVNVGVNAQPHSQSWVFLLPKQFSNTKHYVLNNVILEAKSLKIKDSPHASTLLYRSIIEESLSQFIKHKSSLSIIREHYYLHGEGKNKAHNNEHKKNISVTLSMMVDWLSNVNDIFPKDAEKKLKICTTKLRKHLKTLNNVVHCQCIINDTLVSEIILDTIELIEFFINTIES